MIVYDELDDLMRLIACFADCSLPPHEWTHQAHLIVGLWYCSQHDETQALNILRDRIKRYSIARGKQNTDTSGYHETITRFFVCYINHYLHDADPQFSLLELVNDFCAHQLENSSPLKFYSKERLMSVEARLGWVEPDLQSLPVLHARQNFC